MEVRDELRTCDTSKMVLFCENSLQFKVANNFGKRLHLKICYEVLNLPWVLFQIYIYYRSFFLLLTFLNINGTTTLHTNASLPTGIPQQYLSCGLDVLVNFGQIFALFLGTFIVDFEYYLFIVNATLWHIFVENQKGVIFMGIVAKHLFPTVPMIKAFIRDICL